MFGWRRRSEGFEWQEYVRTTILVRRADRQKRLDDARLAALAKVKDSADRGVNAGKKQVEAVQNAAKDAAVNAGQAAAAVAKQGAIAALAGAKKVGSVARDAAGQVPVPHVPTRLKSFGSLAAMYAADMPRRWRIVKRNAPMIGAAGVAIWVFGILLNPETGDSQVSTLTTGSTERSSVLETASDGNSELRGRAKAISGDVLKIDDKLVRLAGIEAPDPAQVCTKDSGKHWSCGEAAENALSRLVRHQRIACEVQGSDKDQLPLAHCRAGEKDIAAELVRAGHVFASEGYIKTYGGEESTAREAKIGLWQGPADRPEVWRQRMWEEAKRGAPDGCPIKGFVRSGGRKYAMPWSDGYASRTLRTARGERWFCTEEEARAAGFKLAEN